MTEAMHLAFASDDVGVEGLAVAVLTAIENASRPVQVWVIQEGINEQAQAALRAAWAKTDRFVGVTFFAQASLPIQMPGWWARSQWPL